jgi:hypothetical protein
MMQSSNSRSKTFVIVDKAKHPDEHRVGGERIELSEIAARRPVVDRGALG